MIDSAHLLVFLAAAILLAIAPGPGMLYVLARSLAGGRREGLLSALGTFCGGMVHVFAAAAGVSIILAKSAVAFATVKYLGAGYLCFLGVRMILDARRDEPVSLADLQRRRSPFWQGIMTEALNPKTPDDLEEEKQEEDFLKGGSEKFNLAIFRAVFWVIFSHFWRRFLTCNLGTRE